MRQVACFETTVMSKRGKAEKWAARGERLSAALRENLKRRKEQARGRNLALDRERGEKTPPEGTETPSSEFRRNRGRD
jgi:hypothetical protein